jgi:hypothetical protein
MMLLGLGLELFLDLFNVDTADDRLEILVLERDSPNVRFRPVLPALALQSGYCHDLRG